MTFAEIEYIAQEYGLRTTVHPTYVVVHGEQKGIIGFKRRHIFYDVDLDTIDSAFVRSRIAGLKANA